MKIRSNMTRLPILLLVVIMVGGCAPSVQEFIHPQVDLGYINTCAILPFQNLSADGFADERMHSIFLMTILADGYLQVVESGATLKAMTTMHLTNTGSLTPEQFIQLGKTLKVDAIFTGSIENYGPVRSNRDQMNQVTAVFTMVETQTGALVWRAQVDAKGSSVWRKLFGGGSRSLHDVSRSAVNSALRTLL